MTIPEPDLSLVNVPMPSEGDLHRVMGASYDSTTTLNVIKMFAGTEDMYPAVMGFIKAVFDAKDVDAKLREMIVLRVALRFHVRYEWDAQSRLAANVGLTPEEIAAAASEEPGDGIAAEYRLAWQATDEICIDGTLSDDSLSQLLARYGTTVTRKLILIISWFNLLSCFINSSRVPLETTDKIGTHGSPVH